MIYCKKCLQPDTRPNIVFKDGICPVCSYSDTLEQVDWKSRFSILESIMNPTEIPRVTPMIVLLELAAVKIVLGKLYGYEINLG